METQPGSRGTRWSPLKENNYGCKRRYCSGSRSIVPTFCRCWGRCISVTAGESAGYRLVAGGTHRSLNTGKLPRYPYNPHAFPPKSLPLGFWLVAAPTPSAPLCNLLIHTELAGGLAFVYSWLCFHSPGCTVMFSSVVWRTPLSSTWFDKSGEDKKKSPINKLNLVTLDTVTQHYFYMNWMRILFIVRVFHTLRLRLLLSSPSGEITLDQAKSLRT